MTQKSFVNEVVERTPGKQIFRTSLAGSPGIFKLPVKSSSALNLHQAIFVAILQEQWEPVQVHD
jgi:hypothetical protein